MLGSRVRAPEGVRSENRKVLAFFVQSADVFRPATPPRFSCSIQQKKEFFCKNSYHLFYSADTETCRYGHFRRYKNNTSNRFLQLLSELFYSKSRAFCNNRVCIGAPFTFQQRIYFMVHVFLPIDGNRTDYISDDIDNPTDIVAFITENRHLFTPSYSFRQRQIINTPAMRTRISDNPHGFNIIDKNPQSAFIIRRNSRFQLLVFQVIE